MHGTVAGSHALPTQLMQQLERLSQEMQLPFVGLTQLTMGRAGPGWSV